MPSFAYKFTRPTIYQLYRHIKFIVLNICNKHIRTNFRYHIGTRDYGRSTLKFIQTKNIYLIELNG